MRLWKVFYERDQQCQIIRSCTEYPWPALNDDEGIGYTAPWLAGTCRAPPTRPPPLATSGLVSRRSALVLYQA
jgi:hypothetical protein